MHLVSSRYDMIMMVWGIRYRVAAQTYGFELKLLDGS